MFQTRIIKKQLHFKQPAGTSRGVYTTRNVWYILLTDTGSRHYGVGECAPLPALSCDDIPSYDEVLATACKNLEKNGEIDREALLPYPSILFGMETVWDRLPVAISSICREITANCPEVDRWELFRD